VALFEITTDSSWQVWWWRTLSAVSSLYVGREMLVTNGYPGQWFFRDCRRANFSFTSISCGRRLNCCEWQLDLSTELRKLTSTASLSSCRRSCSEPSLTLFTESLQRVSVVLAHRESWVYVYFILWVRVRQTADQMNKFYSPRKYTVSQKKQDTKLLPIISPNVNRFSQFFHWQTP